MAAVIAGVVAGSVMAALVGYVFYRLLNRFRGGAHSQVSPSHPDGGLQQAADTDREVKVLGEVLREAKRLAVHFTESLALKCGFIYKSAWI
jgi:hypothetical protein